MQKVVVVHEPPYSWASSAPSGQYAGAKVHSVPSHCCAASAKAPDVPPTATHASLAAQETSLNQSPITPPGVSLSSSDQPSVKARSPLTTGAPVAGVAT